ASNSPQTVTLMGTAIDFSLTAPTGSSTSQTVSAGQPATYNLQLNPVDGFSGQVSLSCTTTAPKATCGVNPMSAILTNAAVPFMVTVATTSNALVPPLGSPETSPPAMHGVDSLVAVI